MFTLGVILARAGSLGLRNKHLIPLCGKPVIQYTFDAVRRAQLLSKVVVSSDCPNILALATVCGFATIKRPASLATSDASVQDVLLHAMDYVESNQRVRIDAVATLYGNVPIRRDRVIDEAISLLDQSGCDSVRSFCPVGKWHPAWMAKIEGDRAIANRPGSVHRRQDLEPLFLHDGGIVVSSRGAMEAGRTHREDPHAFFGVDRRAVITQNTDTVEVDSRRDLLLAEAILREQFELQAPEALVA
jgi:CMP-N-acetylneuraminic acid synthetase